jgi:hypothetical protein
MKKNMRLFVAFIMILTLLFRMSSIAFADTGRVFTTNEDGSVQNGNTIYSSWDEVYIRGSGFLPGIYYVEVYQTAGSDVKVASATINLIIDEKGDFGVSAMPLKLTDYVNFSAPSVNGEYKVEIYSEDNPDYKVKSDNFKLGVNIPEPTVEPTITPEPTKEPTITPEPTKVPTATPKPTEEPTATPKPTEEPTATPKPTEGPTATPKPTEEPTATPKPTEGPTVTPKPTVEPTVIPTPTNPPSVIPTETPTAAPTAAPTLVPEIIEISDPDVPGGSETTTESGESEELDIADQETTAAMEKPVEELPDDTVPTGTMPKTGNISYDMLYGIGVVVSSFGLAGHRIIRRKKY